MEQVSERELVASRVINGPPRLVFEAWAKPELFTRWWVPKSCPITLVSHEMDVRVGGQYRLTFSAGPQTMDVFGKYLEVTPWSRLVWTNEEGGADAAVITTVSFEEQNGKTLLKMHDLHPSKEALDEAIASGATSGTPESLDQLAELLAP